MSVINVAMNIPYLEFHKNITKIKLLSFLLLSSDMSATQNSNIDVDVGIKDEWPLIVVIVGGFLATCGILAILWCCIFEKCCCKPSKDKSKVHPANHPSSSKSTETEENKSVHEDKEDDESPGTSSKCDQNSIDDKRSEYGDEEAVINGSICGSSDNYASNTFIRSRPPPIVMKSQLNKSTNDEAKLGEDWDDVKTQKFVRRKHQVTSRD